MRTAKPHDTDITARDGLAPKTAKYTFEQLQTALNKARDAALDSAIDAITADGYTDEYLIGIIANLKSDHRV